MSDPITHRITHHHHASALGQWEVAVCQPAPALRAVVDSMWYGAGRVSYARDRILPTAQSFLLVNLGPPQWLVLAGPPERRVPFVDVWFSGLQRGPIDTEAPDGNEIVGVALRTAGAWPLLALEQQHCADQVTALADLIGPAALRLRQRLLDTPGVAARFELLEGWLLDRLQVGRAVHPAVQWAVGQISGSAGQVSIERLASETGYTRKHLNTLFLREVGLAPKALARVQRFRAALALLGQRTEVPWSELAVRCGYYDQSHLVRDFQAFSGYAPGELLRRPQPDGQSVVIA